MNKFGISKSTMVFKISIVKFLIKYPKMKKSSLSLYFLKNNFKIMKEVCHEDASKLEQRFLRKYFSFKIISKMKEKAKNAYLFLYF